MLEEKHWQLVPTTLSRAFELARLSSPHAHLYTFYNPVTLTEMAVATGADRMVVQSYYVPEDIFPSKTAVADYDPQKGLLLPGEGAELLYAAARLIAKLPEDPDPIVRWVLKRAEVRGA